MMSDLLEYFCRHHVSEDEIHRKGLW